MMQWTTFLAAAVGAIAGALGTGIADRFRWHRDVSERERQALQDSYAEFLDSVKRTGSAISQVAHDSAQSSEVRAKQARMAMDQHGLYEKQAHVEICAPESIFPLLKDLVRDLLSLRDDVSRGSGPSDPSYEEVWLSIHRDSVKLREAMRTTLARK
ncbi:hypothetical protein OOK06_08850 [Streptomyces sp. NBC_00340]|uniref:hypothetical protein n=1 Tax=Streptomyces sp. NBC_00340 TaxID=2975716 RepID=UPI002257BC72|nr:hypothetical protein [Streptomyces sp. NBC_00340]MCX5132200.1 hypothetical protein [Streptomyces sp. NBC_00340]